MDDSALHIIYTDGQDTMPMMAQKINSNFAALVDLMRRMYSNVITDTFTAEDGQTVFVSSKYFQKDTNTLMVFVNGDKKVKTLHYNEVSDSSIKFVEPLVAGDQVHLLYTWYTGNGDQYLNKVWFGNKSMIPQERNTELLYFYIEDNEGVIDNAVSNVWFGYDTQVPEEKDKNTLYLYCEVTELS